MPVNNASQHSMQLFPVNRVHRSKSVSANTSNTLDAFVRGGLLLTMTLSKISFSIMFKSRFPVAVAFEHFEVLLKSNTKKMVFLQFHLTERVKKNFFFLSFLVHH